MKRLFYIILLILPSLIFAQAPNFVFVLVDDMGWNGTSVQLMPTEDQSKSDFYTTPNLEQLAASGMVFSQAYAPAAKCSPSRCAILTGQSTARNSYTETGNPSYDDKILIPPITINDIPETDTTIGEWLHLLNLNYRTAHFGKWHLNGGGTSSHGFDEGDGETHNNDGNAADGQTIQTDPKKIFDLTNRSIQFMQNAVMDNVPFYLQISHYAVHGPIETSQSSFDFFSGLPAGTLHSGIDYAGMTKDVDEGIGLVLAEIENLGISDNTYIIFLSDNGAASGMSNNTPLRRGKSFIYEGGIRVPMLIKGPNIPENMFSSEPVIGYDLFPTIADWTGSQLALPADLDGESLVPLFEQETFTRTEPLYFHIPHYSGNAAQSPRSAAVFGNYKLIVEYETGIDYLYDLDSDIGELTDIAGDNETIVQTMRIKLRDHLKSVNANMPSLNPDDPMFSGMAPDIDSDGLLDEWEFRELLSYIYGPNDDPDGDGDDNLTEYNNGTDPLVDELSTATEDLSILNSGREDLVKLFPNPNRGVLHFKFDASIENNSKISFQFYNSTGQLLQEFQKNKTEDLVLSNLNLTNGMYWVKVMNEERLLSTKKLLLLKH